MEVGAIISAQTTAQRIDHQQEKTSPATAQLFLYLFEIYPHISLPSLSLAHILTHEPLLFAVCVFSVYLDSVLLC